LFLSAGIAVSAHYCHGQLKYLKPAITLNTTFLNKTEGQPCCEKEEPEEQQGNCCEEDTYQVFFESNQKLVIHKEFNFQGISLVCTSVFFNESQNWPELKKSNPLRLILPHVAKDAIRILNCSLIYYG